MRSFLRSARGRTILGLTLGILFVPILLGITACLETPIGDPEQGWVDPRVTGVWMAADMNDQGSGTTILWSFEPYDPRTWLVTWISAGKDEAEPAGDLTGTDAASPGPGAADGAAETAPPGQPPEVAEDMDEDESQEVPPRLTEEQVDTVVAALEAEELTCQELIIFKGWLTSIGKSRYLVLEQKLAMTSDRGFTPGIWWVFRVVLRDGGMELSMVELPSGVKTRGEAESIIAARANDPQLVEPYAIMARVPQRHYDAISAALGQAKLSSGY